MIIGTATVYLHANYVHSLKEKRMIVKSIIQKIRNKFNVSIAEVDDNDLHQSIVLGFACVTNDTRMANSVIQNIVNFIEENCDAEFLNFVVEIM